MYRFPTTCSKAVCPHTAYQIVVGGATSECFAASGTGQDRSDPIHSNNLLLDRPVQFYVDRAISNCHVGLSAAVETCSISFEWVCLPVPKKGAGYGDCGRKDGPNGHYEWIHYALKDHWQQ